MKKSILILLITITVISCKTTETDFRKSDLNSISLYNFNNKPTTVAEIEKQWNERLQKNEQINAYITKLEITTLTDEKTNKSELILLGNTNTNSVKTATQLIKFENGLKLSALIASCTNCNSEKLNLGLNSGQWFCVNDSEKENDSCTKIVTMTSE